MNPVAIHDQEKRVFNLVVPITVVVRLFAHFQSCSASKNGGHVESARCSFLDPFLDGRFSLFQPNTSSNLIQQSATTSISSNRTCSSARLRLDGI